MDWSKLYDDAASAGSNEDVLEDDEQEPSNYLYVPIVTSAGRLGTSLSLSLSHTHTHNYIYTYNKLTHTHTHTHTITNTHTISDSLAC